MGSVLICAVVFVCSVFLTSQRGNPLITARPSERPSSFVDKPHSSSRSAEKPSVSAANVKSAQLSATVEPTSSRSPVQVKDVQPKSAEPTFETESGKRYPLRTYKPLANDPYADQWWTSSGGLNTAWTAGAGSQQTTVAVIDTGFALQHEEFAGRWATNTGEQGTATSENPSKLNCTDRSLPLNQSCNLVDDDYDGIVDNESGAITYENPSHLNCTDKSIALDKSCNLIDDDSNGYVDDVTGWDFSNYDANVQAGEINPGGDGTQHGTEVSGILAATGNNGTGLAGVDWTTKILPLQALDDDSYGNTLTVARAIYYAADRGVDVISISLGADEEDTYLRQAIQYALDRGSIVVAASGNDGCNCISYPARYPEVFAVGAHDSAMQPSAFSNYGSNLDILAPGEDMITSTWTDSNPTSAYVGGVAGTSFATPYISGLLSLGRSHQPDASWGELTNALLSTANHTGLSISNPASPQLGSGYAKAGSYVSRVTTPQQPGMRYAFVSPTQTGTLGSSRVFDCYPMGNFPTAPLFEITEGGSTSYTIDTLANIRAVDGGATSKNLGRACVGLPGDVPETTRTINLLGEIGNMSTKSQ